MCLFMPKVIKIVELEVAFLCSIMVIACKAKTIYQNNAYILKEIK